MIEKQYTITAKHLSPLPRNKRRRLTHGGKTGEGGSTVVRMEGSATEDPNSHTHGNKHYLDQITTDENDYLYVEQRHGEDNHTEKNKAKAGYADEAKTLSADSDIRKEFLSRLQDDAAKGKITFEQLTKMLGLSIMGGIHSGDTRGNDTYMPGGLTGEGFGLFTDANGETHLEVDNVVARRRFTVNVLDIQKETFSGGNINLTQANGTVFRVYGFDASGYASVTLFGAEDENGNMVVLSVSDDEGQTFLGHTEPSAAPSGKPSWYKIYFMREDEAVTVEDMWHTGDMALVKDLNLTRGTREWHRVVVEHGVERLEDGKDYNYIIVSNSDELISVTSEDGLTTKNGVKAYDDLLLNSEPTIGDKVVQYGSVTEEVRMGLTRLDSRSDGNGGMFVVEGVGKNVGTAEQFKPTRVPIVITPNQVAIYADSISFVARNEHGEITGSEDAKEKIEGISLKVQNMDDSLKSTGIDIKDEKIIITSNKVVVQNNAGVQTTLIDDNGQITAALINAVKMVTDVLDAETITANNLVIGGNSQFGKFITNNEGHIINNANKETDDITIGTNKIQCIRKDASGEKTRTVNGSYHVGTSDYANYTKMQRPVYDNCRMVGQYIDVKPTGAAHRNEPAMVNAALWMENGTTVGLRPMVRRVNGAGGPVQLTKYDYTVMLIDANAKIDIIMPGVGEIEDGQRIEIWGVNAIDNSITSKDIVFGDTGRTETHRVEQGHMKVLVYDATASSEGGIWRVMNV